MSRHSRCVTGRESRRPVPQCESCDIGSCGSSPSGHATRNLRQNLAGADEKQPPTCRPSETLKIVSLRRQTRGECEASEAHFPTRAVWHHLKAQVDGGANATPFFRTPQTARIHPYFGDERTYFLAFRVAASRFESRQRASTRKGAPVGAPQSRGRGGGAPASPPARLVGLAPLGPQHAAGMLRPYGSSPAMGPYVN